MAKNSFVAKVNFNGRIFIYDVEHIIDSFAFSCSY